jgi:hypothetical protein
MEGNKKYKEKKPENKILNEKMGPKVNLRFNPFLNERFLSD